MAKLTLSDISSLANEASAIAAINANYALIEAAIEALLSRDGTTPNTMSADLDLNSNSILNVSNITSSDNITLNALSTDPVDPEDGDATIWVSDGTDSGDVGDVMMKITVSSTTKTVTLADYSVLS